MINPNTLKPFGKFCVTLGMIPSSYKASLTYEEQLLWFCNYLETKVIPAINNNAEALQEVQALYEEMRQFVVDYFAHLDVQDEIDNKLDEMVEDGTLSNIINQQIFDELNSSVNILNNYNNANIEIVPINVGTNCSSGTIIKVQDKLILVDFGIEENSSNIINFLVTNNYTKFDYAIITHFHTDHIANVTGLKNILNSSSLDFTNCTFIYHKKLNESLMPAYYNNYYNEVDDFIRNVKNYTVINPNNEAQEIVIDENAKLNFYNCIDNFYAQYYSSNDLTNNFSLITLITLNNYRILMTGDSETLCENNYAPELPYNIDVISVPHHGVNQTTSNELLKRVSHNAIYYIMNSTPTPLNRPYIQQALNNGARLYTTNESYQIKIQIINNILSSYCTGQYISKFNYNSEIKANTNLNELTFLDNYTCTDIDIINTLSNMPLNYNNVAYNNQFYIKNIRVSTLTVYQFLFAVNTLISPFMRKTIDGVNFSPWCQLNVTPEFKGTYHSTTKNISALTWYTLLSDNKYFSKWSAPVELQNDGVIKINNVTNTQPILHLSGQISLSDTTLNDRITISPFKNGTEESALRFESYINYATSNSQNTFNSFTFDFFIPIANEDEIELKVRNVDNDCILRSESYVNVEII